MPDLLTRRRTITLMASFGGLVAASRAAATEMFTWRGTALGADATLMLAGADPARAERATRACLAEVERLEQVFSLHRDDSEISRLNRDGRLANASLDLRIVLDISDWLHRRTEGLFDPTVQTLWQHYAGRGRDDGAEVPLSSLLARVGFHRVHSGAEGVIMEEGTAITLNGIAQGYITDRVADLLQRRGWSSVLIDMGEVRALDGRSFTVEVRESGLAIPLVSSALATSSSNATLIGAGTGVGHVLEPATGRPAYRWIAVTVRHPSAAIADGLSTALLLAEREQARRIASGFPDATVWVRPPDGTTAAL